MLSPEDHALFKAYYQNETAYFIKHLERYLNGKRNSFNIKALFLNIFYLCFRKMYKWAIIFILISIILGSMIKLVFSGFFVQMSYNTLMGINQLLNLIFIIAIASYTNKLIIEESIRDIVKIKEQTTDHDERLRLATKKGGVNWIVPFLLFTGLLFFWHWLSNR